MEKGKLRYMNIEGIDWGGNSAWQDLKSKKENKNEKNK